jgi:DNA-binding NarL/FixJ family response regulator
MTIMPEQELRLGYVVFRVLAVAQKPQREEVDSERTPACESEQEDRQATLSDSQLRVAHELLGGLSEKQIALKLHLSPHTVHRHVHSIYQYFGVHSHAELMACFVPKVSESGHCGEA